MRKCPLCGQKNEVYCSDAVVIPLKTHFFAIVEVTSLNVHQFLVIEKRKLEHCLCSVCDKCGKQIVFFKNKILVESETQDKEWLKNHHYSESWLFFEDLKEKVKFT